MKKISPKYVVQNEPSHAKHRKTSFVAISNSPMHSELVYNDQG